MLQLEKTTTADTSEEEYLRIIYSKTASLFETASACAAISVNAAEEIVEAAKEYGKNLGLAFQIKDDILDYAGNSELGKPVGIDIREGKITLPLLGALRNSGRAGEIRSMVREVDSRPENCEEIRRFVLENGGIEYSSIVLDEYIGKAGKALEAFPEGWARDALTFIARYTA